MSPMCMLMCIFVKYLKLKEEWRNYSEHWPTQPSTIFDSGPSRLQRVKNMFIWPQHYSNKELNIKHQSIQINLVVAEIYSFYYGYAIFEQRPRKLAWGLFKGSAANTLVPDTTAHLKGSSGVHASMGQGCFGSKRGTNKILGRWS